MKPLLFLTYRSFVNGVMRALGSPTRLLGLLFFASYYFMWFVRPAFTGSRALNHNLPPDLQPRLEFPPIETLSAVAFAGFSILSLIMMLGGLAQQGAFKPPDVDVLFPTPISPKLVLVFRMIRDYLFTLILPFVLILIGFVPARAGWERLFREVPHPEHANLVVRAAILAWVLMAMAWVAINYALSLMVNRSDVGSDRNKRILQWGIGALVVGVVGYVGLHMSRMERPSDLFGLAESPFLRTMFFTATFATALTMGPISGDLASSVLGGLALVALVGGGVALALSQAGWLYDQAAARGFSSSGIRDAQRRGDALAAAAALAKEGRGHARRLRWIGDLRMTGPWALVWKDLIVQARGLLGMLSILGLLSLAMILLPLFVPMRRGESVGVMYLLMQAMAIFTITISLANVGFLEVLRRIDLQKPLPFRPATIVLFEVGSKAVLAVGVSLFGAVITAVVRPDLWPYSLSATILAPPLSVLLSTTTFLVVMLFPDVEDQTQRHFRGFLMMLGLAVMGLPPILAFAALAIAGAPIWASAIAGAVLCVASSAIAVAVSGSLYANFNPSE